MGTPYADASRHAPLVRCWLHSHAERSPLYTIVGDPSFRQGCRNPSSKDGKLWVTTDALASTGSNKGLASRLNQALEQTVPFGFAQDRHGLDFGIHAEMTTLLAWLDLCITISAERGNDEKVARMQLCGIQVSNPRSPGLRRKTAASGLHMALPRSMGTRKRHHPVELTDTMKWHKVFLRPSKTPSQL